MVHKSQNKRDTYMALNQLDGQVSTLEFSTSIHLAKIQAFNLQRNKLPLDSKS